MGIFPRVARWNADELPDLVLGLSDGLVKLHLNVGTPGAPLFDTGQPVQVGAPGEKVDLSVGYRATPCLVDWNEDGRLDLLVGAYDGRLRLYLNEGPGTPPDFRQTIVLTDAHGELLVPLGYASPTMADFDGDGAKDLVVGNAEGELYYYRNTGTHAAPAFVTGWRCESGSQPIDLGYQGRSRPFACDWDEDGRPDLLVGSNLSKVHLFLGLPNAVAAPPLAAGALRLEAPWPNPANPASTVSFALAQEGWVRLSVHDAKGRWVATLLDEPRGAGRHGIVWRGTDERGRDLPSGLYLLRLEAGGAQVTEKLLLLR